MASFHVRSAESGSRVTSSTEAEAAAREAYAWALLRMQEEDGYTVEEMYGAPDA